MLKKIILCALMGLVPGICHGRCGSYPRNDMQSRLNCENKLGEGAKLIKAANCRPGDIPGYNCRCGDGYTEVEGKCQKKIKCATGYTEVNGMCQADIISKDAGAAASTIQYGAEVWSASKAAKCEVAKGTDKAIAPGNGKSYDIVCLRGIPFEERK